MNQVNLMRKKSRVLREINSIIAVMMRDLTVFFKSPSAVFLSFAMPIVMMGMIGGNLMQNMAVGLGFEFGKFMLVGMLVNMMFMITSMGMTSIIDDSETDFNQEMLVAPVYRYSLVIGKILGSMFGAIISIAGTLVVGAVLGITLPIGGLLFLLALAPLICLSGGAFTMILIGLIRNKKSANMVIMIALMPQMFLSGAIIPINNTDGILMVLSRLMPMTYSLDLARAVVYAGTDEYREVVMFNPFINFAILATLTTICLIIGTYFFSQAEKRR